MKIAQWLMVILMIIGGIGSGICLFALDGIKNPTPMLTAFSVMIGIGLLGNLIICLLRLAKNSEEKDK